MNDFDFKGRLNSFAAAHANSVLALYGGDGTLAAQWYTWDIGGRKALMPVRDYGMCEKHRKAYEAMFMANDLGLLPKSRHRILECRFSAGKSLMSDACGDLLMTSLCEPMDKVTEALAEFTVVSADPTSALRFNVYVDGKAAMRDVIANGAIFATKLGSTGYFKSVSRTIFSAGIGIGLICPAYPVPNLVVPEGSKIRFELAREAKISVTADKMRMSFSAPKGWVFDVKGSGKEVEILGYSWFMCPDCRAGRNSSYVNDSYEIT